MELFESLKNKIQGKNLKIVFPEATDERILGAAVRLYHDELLTLILIGDEEEGDFSVAKENGFDFVWVSTHLEST